MTSSTETTIKPQPEAPRPQGLPKGPLIAVAAFVGCIAALYGMRHASGNAPGGSCQAAAAVTAKLKPLATGEVAAVSVPKNPGLLTDLTFTDPQGQPTTLSKLRGKTVLLNLWATWCVPCRLEMPALDSAQAKLGGDDFEVVAVNIDTNNLDRPKKWLAQNKIDKLAYYSDPSGKIFQELKAVGKAEGMPTSLIIDRQGCELGYIAGPVNWDSGEALALLKTAITGK